MRKRYTFLLFIFLFAAFAKAQQLAEADTPATFAGCTHLNDESDRSNCSIENIQQFIVQNLQYPKSAKESQTEGTVLVSFMVDVDGKITEPEVVYDIGNGCGEEAIRVMNKMPEWDPAKKEGQPVAVKLQMPIQFKLSRKNEFAKIYWGKTKSDTISQTQLEKLIEEPIIIRDALGNTLYPSEMSVILTRKNKSQEATSRGKVNDEIQKLLKKSRAGSEILIQARVQKNGKFFIVKRVLQIKQ